jgi:acetyl-CoA carboxylase biotin carboxyl carrier protein
MKISEIQDLIKFVSKSGVSEVEIEDKDFKLTIKTPPYKRGKQQVEVVQQVAAPVPVQQVTTPAVPVPVAPQVANSPATPAEDNSKYVEIKSPMVGTFYVSPSPDKPAFVNIGDDVAAGKTVCMIEAMKLFNEIESEVSGKIVKILVDDASPVEYDQPLFLVDPS